MLYVEEITILLIGVISVPDSLPSNAMALSTKGVAITPLWIELVRALTIRQHSKHTA